MLGIVFHVPLVVAELELNNCSQFSGRQKKLSRVVL